MIPLTDLRAQYLSIRDHIDSAIRQAIGNTSFIGGPSVEKFEAEFASYLGLKHCIGCGNGTDSLEIALEALGIGRGHEVIVPAFSWISTSEAVTRAGAQPVFADILDGDFTIDPADIERKITARTKAVIPVHLYGLPSRMDEVMLVARGHNLLVIEDCAQAHGASIGGKKCGTFGDVASFSFYPGKNLGAYGDGGALLTDDDGMAEKIRRIGNHGQIRKHEHLFEGRNSRLDSMQAAILSAKLPHLDKWNKSRAANAAVYAELLGGKMEGLPVARKNTEHVYHLFVVRVGDRNAVMQKLAGKMIQSAIHYPAALPFLPAYRRLGHKAADFPVAAKCQDEVLSLPMYPELTREMIGEVCRTLLS